MTSHNRLLIYQDIVKDFYDNIRPRWDDQGANIREIGDEWISQIKDRYQDDGITVQAQDLLLDAINRFYNSTSPEPISFEKIALIMKGGGIKGLAYVGALEVLEENQYEFDWYSGTSAGAIAAILLGSGHAVHELAEILANKNFADFKDANLIQKITNFKRYKGIYEANTFVDWIDSLLSKKLDSSTAVKLQDLPKRTTVYASRKDKDAVIFDSESETYRGNSASFAARCSMSIPYIFTPQLIEGLRVVDGGTKNNFPVEALLKLEPNANFIGLYLGAENFKIERKSQYEDLLSIWMESSDPDILKKYNDKIVIIDPHPISTMKFKLNEEEKEFLIEAGRLGAIKFLDKRSDFDKEDYDYEKRKSNLERTREKLVKRQKKKNTIIKIIMLLGGILLIALAFFQPYIILILLLALGVFIYWIII